MKSLKEIFPRGSKAFLEANGQGVPPCALCGRGPHPDSCGHSYLPRTVEGAINFQKTPRDVSGMNRTESEYALILEAMKRRGEILRYEYEGMTLRWNGVKYTPDFVVFLEDAKVPINTPQIKLIEVKGAWTKGKYERAVERFRHAKTYWPEFQFELHQKTKDGWVRVY